MNKVFVFIQSIEYKRNDLSYVKLKIDNGDSSTIYYDPCKINSECIINLSNIPIFYKNRAIKKVILDERFRGSLEIYDLKEPGNLW